ncbi:alpha/beta fold hydrolase [Zhongshania sp.]|jgi:pimeloyl-[acyl-carrier protein] methyl ester esterase|uniref:alpha/beta fold hydrolase n=1 Tax=Zhongshania sp. TaxID=1971902 RepID=UPI0039E447AD
MNTLDAIQDTYAPDIKHWVFLRGLGREQAHWGDFIQRCEAELGWHCHAIDLPGFGSEHQRPSPLTIADIRRDVQQRLPQYIANTGQAFGVVALSLGGMVALDWLAMAPQDIAKAIFINSSSADCGLLQRIKPGAITATAHALLATSHATQESAILKMVSNNNTQHAELLGQWCHIRQLRPSTKRNVLRQLIAASQFKSPSVASIANAKGHFISSRADRMVSYKCSEYLANKYHCWLTLHSTAGHDLPIDDAAWLIGVFKTIQG